MKTLTITNLRGKAVTRNGKTFPAPIAYNHNVEIVAGKSIRLNGVNNNHVNGPQVYDRTFVIGDTAEYDSYNVSFLGKITSITEKTVTVVDGTTVRRLDLYDFDRRNFDLNLAAIEARNADTLSAV